MHVSKLLNLHPRQVARPLNDIQGWRLPESDDLLGLHRGVLHMLQAMEALRQLEVPIAVEADPTATPDAGFDDREALYALLGAAESALDGYPHRLRIQRVAKQSPGHAAQLERLRREALDKMRDLRVRIDFISDGLDSLEGSSRLRARTEASRVLQ